MVKTKKMASHKARILKKGEIYYVNGGNTKVEIVKPHIRKTKYPSRGDVSEVRLLECSEGSWHENKLAQLIELCNRNLYPENKRGSKKVKILKWKGN